MNKRWSYKRSGVTMEVNRSSTLFLEREMIFPKLEFDSRTEVLQYMAHQFTKFDLAKESYAAALIEREAHFPTGISARAFDIAIPHCASENVNRTSMAVATLTHSVDWHAMDDPNTILQPTVVFMLAIKDPDKQIETLQKIMAIIQNSQLLQDISVAVTRDEIFSKLDPILNV